MGSVYSYVLYPLILRPFASRLPDRPQPLAEEHLPLLSVVIAAHNEAKRIEGKLEDVLRQDYPADRLEIIVVSDASADGTDDLVRAYADRGVVRSGLRGPRCRAVPAGRASWQGVGPVARRIESHQRSARLHRRCHGDRCRQLQGHGRTPV
ncbi:MAG: glycosyltransferase [Gammaproteobacteria bacterium]